MKSWLSTVAKLLFSIAVGLIVLYVHFIYLEKYGEVSSRMIIATIVLFVFFVLTSYVYSLPRFENLRRPLWGFKKTPEGYKDTSIEKYPYVVVTLLAVILASLFGTALILPNVYFWDTIKVIGVYVLLLLAVIWKIRQ
ncbi:hypothetical protein CL654_03015 [bacterium]|nr:hypothetical protein [bacterium]|tara:strand:+ start:5171 stop:5584 length:414 start_codon:yes stop_codon:yes gene_type:complete